MGAAGAWSALGPGLGLSNLRLYAGAVPGTRDAAGPVLTAVLAVIASRVARRSTNDPALFIAWTAAFLISALWLAPAASPDAVAAPIALLALAATLEARAKFDSPGSAL